MPLLMSLVAVAIAFETACPRANAAPAIAAPTTARIKAYSAAAAPDSFFKYESRNFDMMTPHGFGCACGTSASQERSSDRSRPLLKKHLRLLGFCKGKQVVDS